ncbi:MAG: permease-like cell division protein FtsX [Lachnospiraceae bacterium]|nr:permease-like cell division protein FtsX [Lachnospiraceae bacterium]
MKLRSITYEIQQGSMNIDRNKMFSLASIATMTACIFLFGAFFSIIMNINALRENLEEKVGITVLFDEGSDEAAIQKIGEQIAEIPHVTEIRYTSADEAWEKFKEEYFESNMELAEGFKENPIANSASFTVLVDKVENQHDVVEAIGAIDGVRRINQSSQAVQNLRKFNRVFIYASAAIIGILLIVSIILISNTVAVGITVRREEISIMKLIGATDSFVRGPFVVEGIILGLIGSALPLSILYLAYNWLMKQALERFGFLSSMGDSLLDVNEVFQVLLPVGVILGIGIGVIGARSTLKKHLDV